MRKILSKSGFVLLLLCLNCSFAYAGGPWKGKIIDVETKEPLDGAVILAVWERVYRTPSGPSSSFYEAREVVTNNAGGFEIPSYTPINLLPIISNMRGPLFTIFKPGYGSVNGMALGGYFTGKAQEVQDFEISGRRYRYALGVIELPKLKTREERLKIISLPSSIPDGKMPKLIEFINKEAMDLGIQQSHIHGGSK